MLMTELRLRVGTSSSQMLSRLWRFPEQIEAITKVERRLGLQEISRTERIFTHGHQIDGTLAANAFGAVGTPLLVSPYARRPARAAIES
jgi:hypothetical protein